VRLRANAGQARQRPSRGAVLLLFVRWLGQARAGGRARMALIFEGQASRASAGPRKSFRETDSDLADLLQLQGVAESKSLILLIAMGGGCDNVVPRSMHLSIDFNWVHGDAVRTTIESSLGSPVCISAGRPRQAAPICKSSKVGVRGRRYASRLSPPWGGSTSCGKVGSWSGCCRQGDCARRA